MTQREIGNILNGNEVKHSLVKIYELRKFLKLNCVKYPIDMSQFSTAEDYLKFCIQNGLDNYATSHPAEYIVGSSENIRNKNKENYLSNFDENDRSLMDKYWEGTIGYANEILSSALQTIIDRYISTRAELDRKVYSTCAIPVYRFAEEFSKKVREETNDVCDPEELDLSKYRWANSLPGNVKCIVRDGRKYCVVLSENPKLGNYLDYALKGEKGYHFFGKYEGYINPFTYEMIFSPETKYNINILNNFDIKNKTDMMKLEVVAEYVREYFHEVPFCKFVHLSKGLEELVAGYKQVEKIFNQDFCKLMSEKMLKKQKKFLKISKKDAEKLVDENIEGFQSYFNNIFYDMFEWYEEESERLFSKAESPFPEFD